MVEPLGALSVSKGYEERASGKSRMNQGPPKHYRLQSGTTERAPYEASGFPPPLGVSACPTPSPTLSPTPSPTCVSTRSAPVAEFDPLMVA